MIHIVLSVDPLDQNELGYQAPGVRLSINPNRQGSEKSNKGRRKEPNRTPTKEFAAMQMGGKNKKRQKKSGNGGQSGSIPET